MTVRETVKGIQIVLKGNIGEDGGFTGTVKEPGRRKAVIKASIYTYYQHKSGDPLTVAGFTALIAVVRKHHVGLAGKIQDAMDLYKRIGKL